jgi:hypothetical protein
VPDEAADPGWLTDLSSELGGIGGVVGVMLGGSRARAQHVPSSDYDIGVYYRAPLDVAALRVLARERAGADAEVTEPGQWGPWVDGGAWLSIGGRAVDWIYRDLDRVQRAWTDARHGRFAFHTQVGHPLGVVDFAYAGEVALGRVLEDPTGELTALRDQAQHYPQALADAVVERLWEADFLIGGVAKSLLRADPAWTAGCLFRVVLLCAHAWHARAGRWLVNEKGALASTAQLSPGAADFARRAGQLLAGIGDTPARWALAVARGEELVALTRAAGPPSG